MAMISLWFAIAALSLITYAVMDGFDTDPRF